MSFDFEFIPRSANYLLIQRQKGILYSSYLGEYSKLFYSEEYKIEIL